MMRGAGVAAPKKSAVPFRSVRRARRLFGQNNRAPVLIALILLAVGAALLAYPRINHALHAHQARQTAALFSDRIQEQPLAQKDALYAGMLAYNQQLYREGQSHLADAFTYEQADFSLSAYGFDSEIVGYLTVPKLCDRLPVYLGASEANLRRGAAHLSQTSLPVGGENTNAVIAAHRDLSGSDMFRTIDALQPGDAVYFTNYRETLVYQVTEVAIIRPDEIDKILIRPGRDLVTLVTCNPYGYNYERYVVYAERADSIA